VRRLKGKYSTHSPPKKPPFSAAASRFSQSESSAFLATC
jgi:hypothetical protein